MAASLVMFLTALKHERCFSYKAWEEALSAHAIPVHGDEIRGSEVHLSRHNTCPDSSH